jgi:hypothetical protein
MSTFTQFIEKVASRPGKPLKLQPWQIVIVERALRRMKARGKTDAVIKVSHEDKPYLIGIDLAKPGSRDKSVVSVAKTEGKKLTFICCDEVAHWPKDHAHP